MQAFILVGFFLTGTLAVTLNTRQLSHRCDQLCTQQYAPVCGSDGKTYSNICEFGVMACRYQEKGLSLRLVSRNGCGSNPLAHVDTSACEQVCDEDVKPLCASDGVIYNNMCLYKRAECEAAKNHTSLSIVTYGSSCPTPITPDCTQYHIDTSDLAIEGGASLRPTCPSTHAYVCASDGHSYTNECQLCHHMERTNEVLTITYKGVCHNGLLGSLGDLFGGLGGDPLAG